MKNLITIFAALLTFSGVSAQNKIVVKNTSDVDRKSELVEVNTSKKIAQIINNQFVLTNENGQEITYQLVRKNNQVSGFIFQADVKPKASSVYMIKAGVPSATKHLTHARFVPERKDDFAWENDLAAYRMYGPALAAENASNGIDLWLKCVSDTIINKRYRDELQNGLSYHIDRGNGLDCYKVGHTLGAGGIAPYQNGKLLVGDNYNRFEIKENGPLRSTFTLFYDKVKVGNEVISQEITISTIAGSPVNKAIVKYSGKSEPFDLAGGIFTHDGKGTEYKNLKNGIIALAENAVSDAKLPVGRNYIAVIIPTKAKIITSQDNHLLITAAYKTESSFSYYFGGGWSKWKYPTDQAWFDAMEQYSKQLKQPLKVCIK